MSTRSAASSGIDATASDWLMRRDAGLSAAADAELRLWLGADPAHRAAFDRLAHTLAVFDRAGAQGLSEAVVTRLKIKARGQRRQRATLTLVAVLFLAASGWWTRGHFLAPSPVSVAFAAEPVRKLPDGTIVELNTGADIAVRYESAFRRVRLLSGEAHFRVEKDAFRPFIVELSRGIEVRAVGTAFTIQLKQDQAEVVVTEGRVAVEQGKDAQPLASPSLVPAFVDAGHRLCVNLAAPAAAVPQVESLTEAQLGNRLAWRIPRLQFGGMTLGEAAALMNRQNRLQVTFDPGIAGMRISGTFRSDDPEGFVRIVAATFGLTAEEKGDQEMVLRK